MEKNGLKIQDLQSKLWEAADNLRGNMSAEEYMRVVLGLLTLKHINDKYNIIYNKCVQEGKATSGESFEAYLTYYGAFKVSKKSSWKYILDFVGTEKIGLIIDEAFIELEKLNTELSGLFDKNYNRDAIDKNNLSEVVKIFQNDDLSEFGEDIIGRIYEYFLGEFFLKRGQKGGEFYTPNSIVTLLTEILKPMKGKIYDPACGTCGMMVQSKKYIMQNKGSLSDITVYGQEYNEITWKLGKLNLILNGFNLKNIESSTGKEKDALGERSASTFTNDLHKGETFDFIFANPPFNQKKWSQELLLDDPRWKYGLPPKKNANFAWLQHILSKLSSKGKAGVVLANGSLTSAIKHEKKIRTGIIKDNKVSIIILLPEKLFYTVPIGACLWFFDNNKQNNKTLFIDAQGLGQLIEGTKTNKELTKNDIGKILDVVNDYNNDKDVNIPGFAKTVSMEELESNDYSLLLGNYISIKEDDKKDTTLTKKELKENIDQLMKLMDEQKKLEKDILEAIKKIELD